MAETFSGVLQEKINSGNYTETQKKQANDVISSTKKDLDKVAISGVTSDELNEFLEILILEGLTTDGIKDITNQLVSQELADPITEATSENNQSPESTTPETTTTPTGNGAESKKDGEKEITVITDPDIYVEQLQRQGRSEVYIFTKMLSLGFIPNAHKGSFEPKFKGNKWNWTRKNTLNIVQGGSLTNGKINGAFKGYDKAFTESMQKAIFTENQQIKILLDSVNAKNVNINRTPINDQINALNNLKAALASGDTTIIQTASANYASVSETNKGLKGLYERHGVKANSKTQEDTLLNTRKDTEKTRLETEYNTRKDIVSNDLETKINTTKTHINNLKTAGGLTIDLEESKLKIQGFKDELFNLQSQADSKLGLISVTTDATAKSYAESEYRALLIEINTKKGNIITENRNKTTIEGGIRTYNTNHAGQLEQNEKLKSVYEDLDKALKAKNHTQAKTILDNNKTLIGTNLDTILHGSTTFKEFLEVDQISNINKAVDDVKLSKTTKKIIHGNEVDKAFNKEQTRLTNEVNKIETDIHKVKAEVTKKLAEYNNLAKTDPSRVHELKDATNKLVQEYNAKVGELETRGITSMSKLDPDALKLLTTKNKWASGVMTANGWVDKAMGGFGGKAVGVAGMALLAHGIITGANNDGWKSKATFNNILDIGLGMIPFGVGSAYDLWRVKEGTDLNGRKLTKEEKAWRTGFAAVGFAPGVGVVGKVLSKGGLKALGHADDIAKLAKATQVIDAGVDAVKLTGKVAGLGALGYGGYTTITYPLKNKFATIDTKKAA